MNSTNIPKTKSKSGKFCKVNIQTSENTIINIKTNTDNDTNTILPGYNISEIYEQEYVSNFSHCEFCWNCNHSIERNISIPLKRSRKVFYVYGNFCSSECGSRYILDTYKGDKELWEKMSLLNLYYNICNNTKGKTVSTAPPKLRLKNFGGDLTIDEYRETFKKDNLSEIYLPPIIPLKYEAIVIENTSLVETKHNYKLYRKTPVNASNNIYDTMNLITTDIDTISSESSIPDNSIADNSIQDTIK